MISLWLTLALVAAPDTLGPRLPTLKLGRFVIYGLDTLRLQRTAVEAYPRVVYTPEPGVPGLAAGFFAAPSTLPVTLPLPQPAPARALRTGIQAYLLPAYGGGSAGLALRIAGGRSTAEGWVQGMFQPLENEPGISREIQFWGRAALSGQSLEWMGRTLFQRFSTLLFCKVREWPTWGALRAHLGGNPGPFQVRISPWLVVLNRRTQVEGVECGTHDTTEQHLGEGLDAGFRWRLGATRKLGFQARAYRAGDSVALDARIGLKTWFSRGELQADVGGARWASGSWQPVGQLALYQPIGQGVRGVVLYRQLRVPGDSRIPLHGTVPDLLASPAPGAALGALLDTWEGYRWYLASTLSQAAWQTGGAVVYHRRGARGTFSMQVGVEQVDRWIVPWDSRPVTSTLLFFRPGIVRHSSRVDLTAAGSIQVALKGAHWPFLLGFLRFRYRWMPDTWLVAQVRSEEYPSVDFWLQHRLARAFWAAAGVWNLLEEPSLLPQGRRLFVGLWLNTFALPGGNP